MQWKRKDSSAPAIGVYQVGKKYRIYESAWGKFRGHTLEAMPKPMGWIRAWAERELSKTGREFHALQDITFSVQAGESVGLIGRNGSGKSTLLQVIAGTRPPTSGSVKVRGRVAAILELGSGFKPDFTGRENVVINGLILGLTEDEIKGRMDRIAAFADIGKFLDQPVKTYSSGMLVRLVFAVQVALDPDVLIVDEALAVGDVFFQQKCFARMRELKEKGTTILFVSHSMQIVRNLCDKVVFLEDGHLRFFGPTLTGSALYFAPKGQTKDNRMSQKENVPNKATTIWKRADPVDAETPALLRIDLDPEGGSPALTLPVGGKLLFRIVVTVPSSWPAEEGHVGFHLKNAFDQLVCSVFSLSQLDGGLVLQPGQEAEMQLVVGFPLESGDYTLRFSLGAKAETGEWQCWDTTEWFGPISIAKPEEGSPPPFSGLFGLPVQFLPQDSSGD